MPAGPGGVDSNGVYLYGESDSASPVSDMLNLGQSSVSTQLTNDRARLTSLETTANNPNVFVAPSATARDAKYGDPATLTATQRKALQDLGILVWRTDLNMAQRFLALYNATTNPTGAAAYGWYPVEGSVLFSGKRSTPLSVTNTTYTIVTYNTYSVIGGTAATEGLQINAVANPSVFTVKSPGWYSISANLRNSGWSATGGTLRIIRVNLNSTTLTTNSFILEQRGADPGITVMGASPILLAAGDVIRSGIYHDQGTTITQSDTNLVITYLRPANV